VGNTLGNAWTAGAGLRDAIAGKEIFRNSPSRSQSLHVLDKRPFLGCGQHSAPEMAIISVPRNARIIFEPDAFGIRTTGYETDPLRIEDVIPAVKNSRPIGRNLEEISQRRNGPVVKIWSAQPKTLQRDIDVADLLHEIVEFPGVAGSIVVVRLGGGLRPHINAVPVRLQVRIIQRLYLACASAADGVA